MSMWDSARSQIAKSVKAKMIQKEILHTIIRGGLTAYLQASDIEIHKSSKENMITIH